MMVNLTSFTPLSALLEPLPDLKIGVKTTTSSALHEIDFTGALRLWPNFQAEVLNTCNAQTWSQQVIDAKFTGPNAANSTTEEHVVVSCETDVQGRFFGRAGQVLGAVFKAQQQDLMFSSFKASKLPYAGYRKAPDFVIMSRYGSIKVIGEAKVPWIPKHLLSAAIDRFNALEEAPFRHLLGQVATYMLETEIKHGFLTLYHETIFLRKVDVNRKWVLEYSPVIYNYDQGSLTGATGVSLCQCLYHVGLLSQGDTNFGANTGIRNQDWTTDR